MGMFFTNHPRNNQGTTVFFMFQQISNPQSSPDLGSNSNLTNLQSCLPASASRVIAPPKCWKGRELRSDKSLYRLYLDPPFGLLKFQPKKAWSVFGWVFWGPNFRPDWRIYRPRKSKSTKCLVGRIGNPCDPSDDSKRPARNCLVDWTSRVYNIYIYRER